MNYLILIIVAVMGIIIGSYFGSQKKQSLIFGQMERKRENKEKILEFLQENEKITNNDVEKLVNVSDSTAERYLNELEKEGKIKQIGAIGQGVFYRLI